MTRRTPDPVVSDYVAVPPEILSANKHVTLSSNLFFVNKVPFFATISDHIKFTTVQHVSSRKIVELIKCSKNAKATYSARGFNVTTMLADNEFVPMRHDLAAEGIMLNTTAASEHVPKIERQIRVIKERVRATRHTLPFKVIPLPMLIESIYSSPLWINAFPPKGGVSQTLSPRNIMTGVQFDYKKHCQLPFGTYVQGHQEPSPSNSQVSRTVGAICLGPKGNRQGSFKFLSLRTGKLISCRKWTPLPMPQEVIDRVNQLGKADNQPELLTFYDRKGRIIGDTEMPGVSSSLDNNNNDDLPDVDAPEINKTFGALDDIDDIPERLPDPDSDHLQDRSEPPHTPDTSLHDEAPADVPTPDEVPQPTDVDDNVPQSMLPEPEPISDQGAPTLRRSARSRSRPERLVPSFQGQSYQSTTATNIQQFSERPR